MLAAFALSAAVTRLSIGYARRRRLIDQPGARRSHAEPTPRGGGIGIVIAALALVCAPALAGGSSVIATGALAIAIVLVAAAGWIDDHRGLAARWRFALHCLAAAVLLWPIILPLALIPELVENATSMSASGAWLLVAAAAILIVWFINLHNFMDGIDGILAIQAIFVFAAIAVLCARSGAVVHAGQLAILAAATAGFLPFNFPRARIFMGDVGSGVLGLLLALAVLWQAATPRSVFASGLILCSAFVVDASCTLISRMLRGRRWYSAHREHLYQWLARRGGSHARVVAMYAAWNFLVVVPVVVWINRDAGAVALQAATPDQGLAAVAGVYLLGVAVWIAGKRLCLNRPRRQGSHAGA